MNRPHEAEGLLDQIADTALDDDYYVVRAGQPQPSRSFNTLLTGAAFAVFALMVTITAVQTATDRPATQREQRALAEDVSVRRAVSADRLDTVETLQAQVRDLSSAAGSSDPDRDVLGIRTASVPVTGPGLRVTLDPVATDGGSGDVTDADLQTVVNALWFAGAEAISVNGQRIGTLSSIRLAGAAVTVNYVSISPPYEVEAIGDVQALRERFTESRLGQTLERRREVNGLGYELASSSDLQLDAIADGRQQLSHAQAARVSP